MAQKVVLGVGCAGQQGPGPIPQRAGGIVSDSAMSPEMKDEVDTRLLARCISSLSLDLSLPHEEPKWGHLSDESAMTLARYIKGLDKIIEQHVERGRDSAT